MGNLDGELSIRSVRPHRRLQELFAQPLLSRLGVKARGEIRPGRAAEVQLPMRFDVFADVLIKVGRHRQGALCLDQCIYRLVPLDLGIDRMAQRVNRRERLFDLAPGIVARCRVQRAASLRRLAQRVLNIRAAA